MEKYDLGLIQSNIEQMLLRACSEHEQAIIAFGEAHDVYADDFVVYRRAKGDVTGRLKQEGEKVGVIKALAEGETVDLKGKMLKSEGQMKKCRMMVDALAERINAIKFIGKRLEVAEVNAR